METKALNINEIAALWFKTNRISNEYKKVIAKMSQQEIDQYFSDTKFSFGTAGIRAPIGPGTNQLNFFTFQQIAEGYARYLLLNHQKPSVLIGHDNRKNADFYTETVANVLSSFNIEVYLFENNEMTATPIVSYAIQKLNLTGGIIITSSHNPKNYLGFKVSDHKGCQLLDDASKQIVALMPENREILDKRYVPNKSYIKYLDHDIKLQYYKDIQTALIQTDVKEVKKLPVIYTPLHGTGCYDLLEFLNTLNYQNVVVVEEQSYPDSEFPNAPLLNPEYKEVFDLALKYADQNRSDLMFANDPDADRFALAVLHNDQWYYLTGNEMGIIFTNYILENKKFTKTPFVVSTYVTNTYVDRIIKAHNAKIYRVQTGFKWIANEVQKHHENEALVIGFEEAIGCMLSDYVNDKDGFSAAALALEIYHYLKADNKTLIDYLDNIYQKYGYWLGETIPYKFHGENWADEIQKRLDFCLTYKEKQILDLKIHRVWFNKLANTVDWELDNEMWIKFRKSGTEPKFKVYYNLYGNSLEEVHALFNQLKNEIAELIKF